MTGSNWSSSSSDSTGSLRDFVVADDEVLSEEPQTPPRRSDHELFDPFMSPPATRGRSRRRTHKRDKRRFVESDSARQRSLDLHRALDSEPYIASPSHLEAEIEHVERMLERLRRQLEMCRQRRLYKYSPCSTCRRECSISSETVVSDSGAAPGTMDLSGGEVSPARSGEESDGPLLRLRSTRRLKPRS
jgi:hypothetical protein